MIQVPSRKKIFVFLLILSFMSIAESQNLPEKIIVGYWHNWGYTPNTVLIAEVPLEYDVINIAFATPTQPNGANMHFMPDPGIYPDVDEFINDVSYIQTNGKKVVISIGGANHPISLNNPDDVQNFVNSMSTIIDTYGFDGIDIDLEGGSLSLGAGDDDFRFPTTPKIVNMIDAISQLTDLYPDMILSAAPETAYVQGGYSTYAGIWGAYLPLLHALRDQLTYVHVQHYNTGSMYGRDGNIYNPATADFHVAMADMLLAGFNVDVWGNNIFFEPLYPEQVMIGLPASNSAAGSGYTPPDVVQIALDYLILGNTFGGQYQIHDPEGYNPFRGLMTWSINWDIANDLEFVNNHRPYLDNLINSSADQIFTASRSLANYPNPFNPDTKICFSLKDAGQVKLTVYNIKGEKVKTLVDQQMDPDFYEILWNGDDEQEKAVASGVYFYRLQTQDYCKTRKCILLK